MTASDQLTAFIERQEGTKLKAYQDQKGIWTIGTGATFYQNGDRVKQGDKITLAESKALLAYHIRHAADWVNILVKQPLNQFQFDATTSFMFNFGPEKFKGYTLRKLINMNPDNWEVLEKQWSKYIYAGDDISDGLIRRRKEEFTLYRYGKY